ncbi:hypothetical protein EVAR_82616_1 [Eumeta japonica]|uniref:Uncharacterized protein n=1 Tax=Eumeta variegata TaxID=151549 RepID=A0A4C1X2M1_EUMVA|nr:hypothetical protein EVAR_82616_1 [Eumeta japonica]
MNSGNTGNDRLLVLFSQNKPHPCQIGLANDRWPARAADSRRTPKILCRRERGGDAPGVINLHHFVGYPDIWVTYRNGQVVVVVENDDQWKSSTAYSKGAIYEQHI